MGLTSQVTQEGNVMTAPGHPSGRALTWPPVPETVALQLDPALGVQVTAPVRFNSASQTKEGHCSLKALLDG